MYNKYIMKTLVKTLPVDFEGETLSVLITEGNKVWVCIDGQCVLRARGMHTISIEDNREDLRGEAFFNDNG